MTSQKINKKTSFIFLSVFTVENNGLQIIINTEIVGCGGVLKEENAAVNAGRDRPPVRTKLKGRRRDRSGGERPGDIDIATDGPSGLIILVGLDCRHALCDSVNEFCHGDTNTLVLGQLVGDFFQSVEGVGGRSNLEKHKLSTKKQN